MISLQKKKKFKVRVTLILKAVFEDPGISKDDPKWATYLRNFYGLVEQDDFSYTIEEIENE